MNDGHKSKRDETFRSELGKIEIAPEVIRSIAGLAAGQVDGVVGLGGGGVVSDLTQLLGMKNEEKSIRVSLEGRTVIDVPITLLYGHRVTEVGLAVQERVKEKVETLTGLHVDQVNVRILAVKWPTDTGNTYSVERVR